MFTRILFFHLVLITVAGQADDREDFFERRIRPLLVENCVSCHGADKQEGELRLDSRQQVLEGTAAAAALVNPKDVNASRLLQVILYADDDIQMPPKQKLADQQIADLRQWITDGAVWPQHNDFGNAKAFDKDAWRNHWAFQPVVDPAMPDVFEDGWHPIDAFVRQPLSDRGIAPSPMADGRTLVRRLSYAITGLPPTSADLHAAADITNSTALAKWLNDYTDRLLALPQFGERWARYWLDIARYADTKGYVFTADREYKDAWRFREWVINSLNTDMPYSEFLQRQIAGDRMSGADDPAQLAAMGFLTLGRRFLNNSHDIIDDRIDVLARGTMGLTVACARCHDHKFDPIPTADYYALYGVFNSSDEPGNDPSPLRLVDRDKPREPVIFLRGNAGSHGERVTRHFLTALSAGEPEPFTDGSGRLELAKKIAGDDNPLTGRVAVNRIWMRLFGKGLVDSPSDFGVRTGPPSHPELLDHLTTRFVRNHWSRKDLIRYITASMTWRQSSQPRPDVADSDPENRLLVRMSRRRLDFEAWRDSVLDVTGDLNNTIGGTSVDITAEPFPNRRTVYARIDRQNLPGMFRTFDFASPDTHAPMRFETTVPQQALFQLNNDFVMQRAEHLAQQFASHNTENTAPVVADLYAQILRRQPTAAESAIAEQFLQAASGLTPVGNNSIGWQYGYGEVNAELNSVLNFQRLPVAHEGRWAGGTTMPNPKLNYCSLSRDGGHPGRDLTQCSIRRWVADQNCTVEVRSRLKHPANEGDGIIGCVIVNGEQKAKAQAAHNTQAINTDSISLQAGDAIDFVTYCGTDQNHDSFEWKITLQQSVNGQQVREWRSDADFSTSRPETRLSPLAQLAQTLMLTNEFLFVD
ncbi:MAG: PSD1 and planctomycete cytochrome C domain-containing protein [Planctomycetaceae bacterium]